MIGAASPADSALPWISGRIADVELLADSVPRVSCSPGRIAEDAHHEQDAPCDGPAG
jgi:hypothetical protein